MTGAGGLSSSPQPVKETLSALSLSAGRCGAAAPAEGEGRDLGSAVGKAFPSKTVSPYRRPNQINYRRS